MIKCPKGEPGPPGVPLDFSEYPMFISTMGDELAEFIEVDFIELGGFDDQNT